MKEISAAPDGFVAIDKLMKFNRIASVSDDSNLLIEAVKLLPELLTCSDDRLSVKRIVSAPVCSSLDSVFVLSLMQRLTQTKRN
jgi:hypothetical protein